MPDSKRDLEYQKAVVEAVSKNRHNLQKKEQLNQGIRADVISRIESLLLTLLASNHTDISGKSVLN